MINQDHSKFRHDRSAYQRPTFPYVCGRGAFWRKPCAHGPHFEGTCGGTHDCKPFNKDDRWICRRPDTQGGPCEQGPLPDGTCGISRPPCVPQPTLRRQRGKLTAYTAATIAAILILLAYFQPWPSEGPASVSAGPLTQIHANFSKEEGCSACHTGHGSITGVLAAAFTDNKIAQNCTNCHSFGGPLMAPHNSQAKLDKSGKEMLCVSCHTEHKGKRFNLTKVSNVQCARCHGQVDEKIKFASFAGGHSDFGANFPYQERTSIRFDHNAHVNGYFKDDANKDKAPQGCVGCHKVDGDAAREVKPSSFEETCAGCHAEKIPEAEFKLFALPELVSYDLKPNKVRTICGEYPQDVDDEYSAVSLEEPTAVAAYLFDFDSSDSEAYSKPVQKALWKMVKEGKEPLTAKLAEMSDEVQAEKMLAGLNSEFVQQVACAWAENTEYEAPSESSVIFGGWTADGLTIKYRPSSLHKDEVALAWVEFASQIKSNPDSSDNAKTLADEILSDKEGIGACAKCHALSDISARNPGRGGRESGVQVEWKYRKSASRELVKYNHAPHLNLLGPGTECFTCHAINPEAKYLDAFVESTDIHKFESNFKPIAKATCEQCHGKGQVRSDCQLCHNYHVDPALVRRMMVVDAGGAKAETPPVKEGKQK